MSKGLLYYLVSFNNLDHGISSIESVRVVNEFNDVFPNDFLEFLPVDRLTLVSI